SRSVAPDGEDPTEPSSRRHPPRRGENCPCGAGVGGEVGTVTSVSENLWIQMVEERPGHSEWYVQRFRTMADAGEDLDGEARLVGAMAPRGARILDAGGGPGRVGGYLHRAGHTVVGVDLDPVLIAAAEEDHPGPAWLVGD